MKILISAYGQIGAFDKGEQVGELQQHSILTMLAEKAEKLGYDPETFDIEFPGTGRIGKIINQHKNLQAGETPDYPKWNWQII